MTVIFIIVPATWLAALLFGLTMCRLAALSDDSQAMAVAEWIATNRLPGPQSDPVITPPSQLPYSPRDYRATG